MSQEEHDTSITVNSCTNEANEKVNVSDSVEVKGNCGNSNQVIILSSTENIIDKSNNISELTSNDHIPNKKCDDVKNSKSERNLSHKLDNDKEICDNISKVCENSQTRDTSGNNKNEESAECPSYDPANVHYEGDIAIYTDPTTNYQYQWDKDEEKWIPKSNITEYGFEDDTHTYTDADGVKFFWDKEKNAWFPKINDDFMAQYQINYGFIDNTSTKEIEPQQRVEKLQKEKEPTGKMLSE